jgi:hypothetical protein
MKYLRLKPLLHFLVYPGKFFIRRDFPVFLFCLFISTSLWLIIRFSQPYELVISVPLKYTGMSKNLALVSYTDSVLKLKATLRGIQVVSYRYLSQPKAFDVNITTLRTRKVDALRHKAYLPVSQLLPDIVQQLGIHGQVSILEPDTLFFFLEKRMTRRLPVRADVVYQIPQGMMPADTIKVVPEWVEVTGPVSILDTLSHIYTSPANVGILSSDQTLRLELKRPVPHLPFVIKPSQVEVKLSVDKYMEAVALVPVSLPDTSGCRLKLIPDKVKLHLVMPMRRYREFVPAACMVGVSCPPDEGQGITTLPVHIIKLPSYVRCLEIEPPAVEFLILN